MGSNERRARERNETRAKILDAARTLFAAEGYDAVTIRKIAERIEYSPTAIYVHFKDKESLFAELCETDFAALGHVFKEVLALPDPADRLWRIGETYIRFGLEYPNHYRLMFMTPRPKGILPLEGGVRKGNPDEDAYAMLKVTVEACLAAGCFREDLTDPDLIAQTLWAAVHGVVSLQIAKGNDPWCQWRPVEDRGRAVQNATMRGIWREGRWKDR